MPSRTAMVLRQNGVSSAGDPFLGALVRGAFAIGKGVVRLFKGRAKAAIGAGTAVARRPAVAQVANIGRRVALAGAGAAGTGAAFGVGLRVIGTDEAGNPVFARRRRRRGITATELRGFRKITSLLHRVGMTPRGLGRVRHHHHR